MREAMPPVGFKKLPGYFSDSKNQIEQKPTLVGQRSGKRDAGGTVFLLSDGLINVSLAEAPSVGVPSSALLLSSTIAKMHTEHDNTSEKRPYVKERALRNATERYVSLNETYVTPSTRFQEQGVSAVRGPRAAASGVPDSAANGAAQSLYTLSFTYYVTVYGLRKGGINRVLSAVSSEVPWSLLLNSTIAKIHREHEETSEKRPYINRTGLCKASEHRPITSQDESESRHSNNQRVAGSVGRSVQHAGYQHRRMFEKMHVSASNTLYTDSFMYYVSSYVLCKDCPNRVDSRLEVAA